MKKMCLSVSVIVMLAACAMLQGCGTKDVTEHSQPSIEVADANPSKGGITSEMAYEGVSNYCHSEFDWSVAEENPSIMYVEMGGETESEYEVIFRSYTGSLIHFYVNKQTGTTRMKEYVPSLEMESDAGTIELLDYLDQ